ncbi:MAG: hypothetical protein WCT04_11140 [Planctomycetota bacterium]
MFPSMVERIPTTSAESQAQKIRRDMKATIVRVAAEGSLAIERRLHELNSEWPIERMLEANAATASLLGLTLGATVNKKFLILPAIVAGCMLQQSIQGWCPPLGVLRRMGYRTRAEIEQERYALKALRGDFSDVRKSSEQVTGEGIDKAMNAVQI